MPLKKEQLLDGALNAWNIHGLRRTSLRRIAEAASVGEPTLLRYFDSKAGLLQAALDWEVKRFLNRMSDTGDARIDLLNLVKASQSLFARRGRLVLDLALEFPLNSELENLTQIVAQAIFSATAIVEKYQALGVLRKGDSFEVLFALVGPLMLPTIKHEPWQQLAGGAESRLEAFLECWEEKAHNSV